MNDKFEVKFKNVYIILSLFLYALSTSGCSAARHSDPNANSLAHIVTQNGETLELISKWFTGSVKNWRQILSANPTLDVRKIKLGTEILIPAELITNRRPMPAQIVQRYQERLVKRKTNSPSETAPNMLTIDSPAFILPTPSSTSQPNESEANEEELDQLIEGLLE